MTKEEAIAQFDLAVVEAKGALFDAGVASVPASPVDMGLPASEEEAAKVAAVNAAVAPLNEQLVALSADLDAVIAAKTEIEGKLAVDEAIIGGLKGSIEKLQGALDALKSVFGA
jgi:hypothetical protein